MTLIIRRRLSLLLGLIILVAVSVLSLSIGAKSLPLSTIIDSLLGSNQGPDSTIILEARLPRTLIGIFGGAALGVAGALMQSLTRNPLADPGIIGVNSGAGLAVTLAYSLLHVNHPYGLFAASFIGALLTTVIVYLISIKGEARPDPMRFVLAGLTIGAMLSGLASAMTLIQPQVFNRMRFWMAGSLDVGDLKLVLATIPLILIGLIAAFAQIRSVNAMEMGRDTAKLLGENPARTLVGSLFIISLLSAAVTAVTGPIGFVGLMVPYIARWAVGPDLRYILPFTCLYAPILMLTADIVGRLIVLGELRVSIVMAFVGAPVLIMVARSQMIEKDQPR